LFLLREKRLNTNKKDQKRNNDQWFHDCRILCFQKYEKLPEKYTYLVKIFTFVFSEN
jgi:hypothetical protein